MDDSLMGVSSGSALMREGPEVGGEVAMVVEAEVVAEDTEEEEMIVATVEVEMIVAMVEVEMIVAMVEAEIEMEGGDVVIPGTDVAPGLAVTPAVAETGVMTGIGGTGAGRRGRLGAGPGHRI